MRPATNGQRIGLAVVIALVACVAIWWAYRVPLYQEPDELAHTDYVFSLFDAGTFFAVRDGVAAAEVAPQTRYLVSAVGYRAMRYNPIARAPAGYGSPAFVRQTDRAAPAATGHVPRSGEGVPYVMFLYPYTYYAIELLVLKATLAMTHSLALGVFAMRSLGVATLVIVLICSEQAMVRSGVDRRAALAATLGIGLFPLNVSISTAVQPDTLVAACIAATLLGVTLFKRPSSELAGRIVIIVALTLVAATKQHYAAAAYLATLPVVLLHPAGKRARLANVATAVAPIVAYWLASYVLGPVRGTETAAQFANAARHTTGAPLTIVRAYDDFANAVRGSIDGGTAQTYWLQFGFRGARIFGNVPLGNAIAVLTVAAFLAFAFAEYGILGRIARIAARRSPRRALVLLAAGHPTNTYIAVSAALLAASIASTGALELQGRYWLPVLPALALIGLRIVPRPARVPERRRFAFALALAMAAYGVVACTCATIAMERNYYGPRERPAHETVTAIAGASALALAHPRTIVIRGAAVDMLTGFPARSVYAIVDGARAVAAARYGLESRDLMEIFHDGAIRTSGFALSIPAAMLQPGHHRVAFFVGDPRKRDGIPFNQTLAITVGS